MAKIAVLGTGIMGTPIARNLLSAGFEASVWNRRPRRPRWFRQRCDSSTALALGQADEDMSAVYYATAEKAQART